MLKGRQGHVEVTEHQHKQDVFFTLKIQQKGKKGDPISSLSFYPTQIEILIV